MRKNNTPEAHNCQRLLEYGMKHCVEVSIIGDASTMSLLQWMSTADGRFAACIRKKHIQREGFSL